ncbi:MAG TPA: class I SAM-dependent methyltransferase [Solirubrobacteraceae bacterium]|nr:class I SAM-dependent methyltransferase [Solirubrobacteraceae bacterium]
MSETDGQNYNETLRAHRDAWEGRPLLRSLYREWFGRVEQELSQVAGPCVELGSGIGAFKDFRPATVATDIGPTPWADEVVDAQDMPYEDASVGNLVMIDVLHHVPSVSRFFAEARRVLLPGGRVVLVEPYCSPVSTLAYKLFHDELTDLSVDPFGDKPLSSGAPYDGNMALATLIFWRQLARFQALYPALRVRDRLRLAFLAYPLSGGFTKPPLLPSALDRPVARLERYLGFAAPVAAFRCLVTLERR